MTILRLGADIGQKVDPTAIVITETSRRVKQPLATLQEMTEAIIHAQVPDANGNIKSDVTADVKPRMETVYTIRSIERLPLGTSYVDVASHIRDVLVRLRRFRTETPDVLIDATGVGQPVVDILRRNLAGIPHRLIPVLLTNGNSMEQRVVHGYREYHVGKTFLAARLQAILQTHRAKMPRNKHSEAMHKELGDFQIRAVKASIDQFGAFQSGTHDDLVIAMGLACLEGDEIAGVARTLGDTGPSSRFTPSRPMVGKTARDRRLSSWL